MIYRPRIFVPSPFLPPRRIRPDQPRNPDRRGQIGTVGPIAGPEPALRAEPPRGETTIFTRDERLQVAEDGSTRAVASDEDDA